MKPSKVKAGEDEGNQESDAMAMRMLQRLEAEVQATAAARGLANSMSGGAERSGGAETDVPSAEDLEAMREAARARWDDDLGYDLPDTEWYINVAEYERACLEVQKRRARRNAREKRGERDAAAQDSVVQNCAELCTLTRGVSEEQNRAILGLLIGKSDSVIAYELGVHRNTVGNWRKQPEFRLALHNAQKQLWGEGIRMARITVLESIAEMRSQLRNKRNSEKRFRAAQTMIYMVGSKRLEPTEDENDTA